MGKHSRYNRSERKILLWANIHRYSPILSILFSVLLFLFIYKICKIENFILSCIPFFVICAVPTLWGCYTIIGAILEWKHIRVSLQLSNNRHPAYWKDAVNPHRAWTPKEKRDMIGVGIISVILGIALIVMIILGILGIL